jgi:hypothetical protein
MNADLDRHLDELGPEYRRIVERLVASRAACEAKRRRTIRLKSFALASAAAVALFLAVGVVCRGPSAAEKVYTVRASDAASEYLIAHARNDEAVKELVRTQRADGGWGSDFLTRQNTLALSRASSPEARLAYRKALRNMRLKGLSGLE